MNQKKNKPFEYRYRKKIKLLCNRQEETIEENKYKNTEIEEHSKLILNHYGDLLKNSSVDFDKEALII